MSTTPIFDMSKATTIPQPLFDMSKAKPVSGPAPLDISNPQGQGLYTMKDASGAPARVPYGKVQQAAQAGYQFADDDSRFRYAKDNAADPNRVTSYTPPGGSMTEQQAQQREQQIEAGMSAPMQAVAGVAKGAGTLARPVLDVAALGTGQSPQDVDAMLRAQGALQTAAKVGTIGAAIVPAAIAAPGATAGALAAGTAGAVAGGKAGQAMGMGPQGQAAMSDVGALAGGVGGAKGGAALGDIASDLMPGSIKARAAGLLQSVAHDANKVPVQIDNAADAADRLIDWQKKTTLGPTVNKFLNRITNPRLGPMTYEDARDYYQLLGQMSSDETSKLAPPVRRDLVQMVIGLKQDIGNAADQVGRAADYYKGLKDYSTGAKLENWYDAAKDWGIKAGIGAGLAAAGAGGLTSLYTALKNQ